MTAPKLAEEMAKKHGLVCLVPKPGKSGISCHEKTLCDCQVIALLEEVGKLERKRALEEAADMAFLENRVYTVDVAGSLVGYANRIRALISREDGSSG